MKTTDVSVNLYNQLANLKTIIEVEDVSSFEDGVINVSFYDALGAHDDLDKDDAATEEEQAYDKLCEYIKAILRGMGLSKFDVDLEWEKSHSNAIKVYGQIFLDENELC